MSSLTTLRAALSSGRTPHAVILAGTADSTAEAVLLLSQSAVCEARSTLPCVTCNGCRKAAKGEHPDILTITPEDGKAEISVKQIRAARSALYVRANEAPRRVVVIPDAERLNTQSQNALLAVMEEPPAPTLWILQTPRDTQLLPTVRSRAQTFRFAPQSAASSSPQAAMFADAIATRDKASLAEACAAVAAVKNADLPAYLDAVREGIKLHPASKYFTRALELCDANVTPAAISGYLLAELLQFHYITRTSLDISRPTP